MSELPPNVTVIQHPLVRVKLTRLRDERTRSEEFRARLAELATLLAFEATRGLHTRPEHIRTPDFLTGVRRSGQRKFA